MRTVHKIATYMMVGTLAFAGHTATVKAAETPIAGIDLLLSDFYFNTQGANLGISSFLLSVAKKQENNLAFAKVNDYVNIRSQASEESEILGKLYKDNAADILKKEGDWYQVKSGSVSGYIKADYLITGDEAEEYSKTVGDKMATVTTTTLRVREKASPDAPIVTLVPIGDEYEVTKVKEEWVKIVIDENTSGYVSADFVEINKVYGEAISTEEEQAKLAEEQAKLAEEAVTVLSTTSSNSSETTRKTSSSKNESSDDSASRKSSVKITSSSNSSIRDKLVSYASQFEGNPYVWGGTSLTNGADCSGFTQSIFEDFGIYISRTSRTQATGGKRVSIDDIQPGDLIFYQRNGTINHVALYIGNGKVIGAKSSGEGIRITNYNYRTPYKAVSYIN